MSPYVIQDFVPFRTAAQNNDSSPMNYNSIYGFVVIDAEGSRNFDLSYRRALCLSLVSLMGNSGSDLADLRHERALSKPEEADFEA